MGKDIGALQGLVEVAEDVVDDDNGLGGVGGASDIFSNPLASQLDPNGLVHPYSAG